MPSLLRNATTLAGAAVTTTAALLFLALYVADTMGFIRNPYLSLLCFIAIPGIFLLGLALMPLGVWRERRRRLKGLEASLLQWPVLDFASLGVRRVAFAILVLTPVNVAIVALAGQKAVETTDSVAFCGATCHVMQPEAVAYEHGPHANVACAECHVGSGATSFIKAKLAGTRQLLAVVRGTYPRPIPAPHELITRATDTCSHCHDSAHPKGEKTKVFWEYADDEQNTEGKTTVRLNVGGRRDDGAYHGAHWHNGPENSVEYVESGDRASILYVSQQTANGPVEYFADGVTASSIADKPRKTMDCVTCHNRPAHSFELSPERAVNRLMGEGALPKDLPYLKREAVALLRSTYPTREAAASDIPSKLAAFYAKDYAALAPSRKTDITRAASVLAGLHTRNVFPAMNLGWGFHPNNLGHNEFPGCFRCHDDSHKSKDGKTIFQDCERCHEIS